MLGCILALTLAPEAATASEPHEPDELPHWRNALEPPPEQPAQPPKVPSTGAGLITLGSVLLGTGATYGLTSVALTLDNDPRRRSARETGAVASGVSLGAGALLLTLGLVVRRQFRHSAAGNIEGAPRTGGGMLVGGLGLIVGGAAFTAHAVVDLSTFTCSGTLGCYRARPIGSPIELGLALAGIAVGSGLVVGGMKRRLGYQRWALQRAQLQPTFTMGPTSFTLGLAGRF